jgi:hypothetical protein|tara:strand:- start:21882 stop:22247 length:366 start_codon:yes stop_codon:yes gene_type:complete
MALTLSWEVTGVKTRNETNTDGNTLSDAIVQTYWKCKGVDSDGNEGSFSGATPFSAANVPVGSFVPFANLNEEVVLGWIRSVVVGDYSNHVQMQIQNQIDDASVQEPEMPWAPEPTSGPPE